MQKPGQNSRECLKVEGLRTFYVKAGQGYPLFQKIPNAELHIFNRAVHWVEWDQADRFNKIVIDFLRS